MAVHQFYLVISYETNTNRHVHVFVAIPHEPVDATVDGWLFFFLENEKIQVLLLSKSVLDFIVDDGRPRRAKRDSHPCSGC